MKQRVGELTSSFWARMATAGGNVSCWVPFRSLLCHTPNAPSKSFVVVNQLRPTKKQTFQKRGNTVMAKVLILGGGFAGVVAAKRLAEQLGDEHQITMVSRSRYFVFYPALVRLAFGNCQRDDVSFDLRRAMLDRRVN